MTNPYPYGETPPAPKRKRNPTTVVLVIVAALLALCCSGLIVAIANSTNDDQGDDRGLSVVDAPAGETASGTAAATPKPKVVPTPAPVLSVRDVTLKVKITSKQCFGSAGCNLQYEISNAAVTSVALIPDECDVTYEVRGFDDGTQIHTLRMSDDGTYEQDSYQSGSTSSSAKKLTVKVTDVECR